MALFLHHTHTSKSNILESDVPYLKEQGESPTPSDLAEDVDKTFDNPLDDSQWMSHRGDYMELAEALPDDISFVATRTEHYATDPTYYNDLQAAVEERNGTYETHDAHATFQLPGKEPHVIINGAELSVEDRTNHYTLVGYPLDDDRVLYNLSADDLYEEARNVDGWASPAHPFIADYEISGDQLNNFFDEADDCDNITAAINYTTGYWWPANKLARGELGSDRSVYDYADTYNVPFIPELDHHSALPNELQGVGQVDDTVIDKLWDGDLPVDDLLDADIVSNRPGFEGLTMRQMLRTYPDIINQGPVNLATYGQALNLLPAKNDDFDTVYQNSLNGLSDIDENMLSTYDPRN